MGGVIGEIGEIGEIGGMRVRRGAGEKVRWRKKCAREWDVGVVYERQSEELGVVRERCVGERCNKSLI